MQKKKRSEKGLFFLLIRETLFHFKIVIIYVEYLKRKEACVMKQADLGFVIKLFKAYEQEYGKGAKMNPGDVAVFELQNCTAVMSFDGLQLDLTIVNEKPIRCDFSCDSIPDPKKGE